MFFMLNCCNAFRFQNLGGSAMSFKNSATVFIKVSTTNEKHHTVIPSWIYRIPSELRSQAGLGLPSTVVGDHTGIVGAVCFF